MANRVHCKKPVELLREKLATMMKEDCDDCVGSCFHPTCVLFTVIRTADELGYNVFTDDMWKDVLAVLEKWGAQDEFDMNALKMLKNQKD